MFLCFRYLLLSVIFGGLLLLGACEPEEEKIDPSPALSLTFSSDTVQFDTVFTGPTDQIRNITRRLLVYNPNTKAVEISSIALAGGNASAYDIFINGQQKPALNNQVLLGGDSLLILINLQINPRDENVPFLVKDSIVFKRNEAVQDVKLIGYGQDAHFVPKGTLACNANWTAEKPYVIEDTVWVEKSCSLQVEKGAKIYFNNHAALMVAGQLKVMGEAEETVLLSNSRLDLKNEVGLWGGIHFLPGSSNNEIYFTIVRNMETGIFLEGEDTDTLPDLIIGNTKIENAAGSGIYARNSDVYAFNTLVDNALLYAVENEGGGNYTYIHCTFVNYPVLVFSPLPVVFFSDTAPTTEGEPVTNPLKVKLYNSIIWSSKPLHSGLSSDLAIETEGSSVSVDQGFNLLHSIDESQNLNENVLAQEPLFPHFVAISQYQYLPDSLSPVIDKGKDLGIAIDLEGRERDEMPDIGAYEYLKEE